MITFDDLTLGEVEQMTAVALKGATIDQADPLMLAGAVMWMAKRRDDPTVEWETFKNATRMAEIKSFAMDMEAADELDPTNARNVPTT